MKGRLCGAVAALALAAQGGAAGAQTLEDAAAMFAARETIRHASLSPSGNKLAFVAPFDTHGEAVFVVDLTQDNATPVNILHNTEIEADIDYCDWATEARLVCGTYFNVHNGVARLGFTRLFAVSADGSDLTQLTRSLSGRALGINQDGGSVVALDVEGRPGHILMTREFVPEFSTGTRLANARTGLGVEEIDIDNLRAARVELPTDDAVHYIADDTGRVRIMIRHPMDERGVLGAQQVFYYRTRNSEAWERLGEAQVDAQSTAGFYPVAVDSARDVVFGFEDRDGYAGLYTIALDGSGRREQVLARGDVDVDNLIRIGRRNRVVGASYATEKREVSYIDPELARLAESLGRALRGTPLIDIVDASADESKLLIIASSDTDPGMTYLYDKGTRRLGELLPLRDQLAGASLAQMTPVTFPAADGTQIPGYLTLPPGTSEARGLPAIVLPHGGPSARDEWGFDWLVQFFASQGYAVLQPNFRGSAGYGSAWFGRNGFQAWETAIGDVNDAGRWLVAQGMADPAKLAIVGWSYGGYAALQSQVLDPQLYKAVVAIAPVTDLELLRQDALDYTSGRLVDRFIGRGDHVRAGSPAQNAQAFAAPVLLFHGTADQNVEVGQSRRMESRLRDAGKPVTYVEFDGLAHSLDDSTARLRLLTETARFLEGALGS